MMEGAARVLRTLLVFERPVPYTLSRRWRRVSMTALLLKLSVFARGMVNGKADVVLLVDRRELRSGWSVVSSMLVTWEMQHALIKSGTSRMPYLRSAVSRLILIARSRRFCRTCISLFVAAVHEARMVLL
jgi:hypothetical protein